MGIAFVIAFRKGNHHDAIKACEKLCDEDKGVEYLSKKLLEWWGKAELKLENERIFKFLILLPSRVVRFLSQFFSWSDERNYGCYKTPLESISILPNK